MNQSLWGAPGFGPADLALLLRSRSFDPAVSCLTFEERTWTVSDVHDTADVMAAALRAAGVGRLDVVATCCENRAEFLPLMLAVWSVGAALAPLNALLTADERSRILVRLRPRVVIGETSLDWPSDGPLVAGPLRGADGFEMVVPGDAPRQVQADTALILHTSGTTAQPKSVALSAGNLVGAMESVLRLVRRGSAGKEKAGKEKAGRGAPNLVAFPQAHLAGVFSTLLGLYNDREVLLMRRFEVTAFLALVERHRVPSVILNPTMVYMLCDAPGSAEAALASLRFVRSGSSRLSPTLATRFYERFGVPVLNCYGQTETAGEVIGWTVPDLPRAAEKLGSVGRPHHGVSLRFVDEHLADVTSGEVGELCVKAPFVMDGYLDADSDGADFVDGGFLRTGDLGRIDADGFVWLVGRRKEIISCGGFKILPEEVEEALRSHPAVGDVMVAGVPDERLGETPCAFVVARSGAGPDGDPSALAAALADHARARLARYKLPRDIRFVDALPRNATGKVLRARAGELLAATAPALTR
jgi:long-chain acyl-CoA synthetase